MTQQAPWTETRRRTEKADEERYCAEQDRQLLEKHQRQPAPAARPPATGAAAPAEPTPPAPAAPAEVELAAP